MVISCAELYSFYGGEILQDVSAYDNVALNKLALLGSERPGFSEDTIRYADFSYVV